MTSADRVDPDLREPLAQLKQALPGGLGSIQDVAQRRLVAQQLLAATVPATSDRVVVEDRVVPGPAGAPDVRVRLYRPTSQSDALPCLYYIHGGGMTTGGLDTEDTVVRDYVEHVNCAAVSIEYRLAPENPHPAPIEDCYAGLVWLASHCADLGIDAERIAISGTSAGGGLAAATTLLSRDRSGPPLVLQLLAYPMLDDRNVTPSSREFVDVGVWDRDANILGWKSLLGVQAGSDLVSPYAAPARAINLTGLPPAYVDVGELDVFRDECIDYATRLLRAGVATELHIFPGAYHGWNVLAPNARVTAQSTQLRHAALTRAFASKARRATVGSAGG